MLREITFYALDDINGDPGIDEICRPYGHGCRACNEELYRILPAGNSADADDWNIDRTLMIRLALIVEGVQTPRVMLTTYLVAVFKHRVQTYLRTLRPSS